MELIVAFETAYFIKLTKNISVISNGAGLVYCNP